MVCRSFFNFLDVSAYVLTLSIFQRPEIIMCVHVRANKNTQLLKYFGSMHKTLAEFLWPYI